MQELLKSDSICQSYVQMKKGPVFLTHRLVALSSEHVCSCGRGMYGVICRLKYVEMLQKGAIWIHLFTFTADDIVSETNNFIGN